MNLLIMFWFWCLLAVGVGLLTIPILNRIPPFWLCEWDQEPELRHIVKKLNHWPWSVVFGTVFFLAADQLWKNQQRFRSESSPVLSACYLLFSLLFLWLLLQTALLDQRFLILTDQHTLGIFLIGLGFVCLDLCQTKLIAPGSLYQRAILFHDSWASPVLGALLCGGTAFLISLTGERMVGSSCLGFGDVKLFAALGFAFGQSGGVFVLLCSFLLFGTAMGALLLLRLVKLSEYRAFGPYIAGSAALWLLFGSQLSHF